MFKNYAAHETFLEIFYFCNFNGNANFIKLLFLYPLNM